MKNPPGRSHGRRVGGDSGGPTRPSGLMNVSAIPALLDAGSRLQGCAPWPFAVGTCGPAPD